MLSLDFKWGLSLKEQALFLCPAASIEAGLDDSNTVSMKVMSQVKFIEYIKNNKLLR